MRKLAITDHTAWGKETWDQLETLEDDWQWRRLTPACNPIWIWKVHAASGINHPAWVAAVGEVTCDGSGFGLMSWIDTRAHAHAVCQPAGKRPRDLKLQFHNSTHPLSRAHSHPDVSQTVKYWCLMASRDGYKGPDETACSRWTSLFPCLDLNNVRQTAATTDSSHIQIERAQT